MACNCQPPEYYCHECRERDRQRLKLVPVTVKAALPFVARVHRHLPRVQGAMWAIGVKNDEGLVGVALVGWAARVWNGDTLAVLRVAVMEGYPNACSMLYGACSRAAKAMGVENLVTYTRLDEHGSSLKAANWVDGGTTEGGEWGRDSRPREAALFPESKRRWWAPWSRRANAREEVLGKAHHQPHSGRRAET